MAEAIYLLRHGETVWNRDRRIQGQLDAPLTRLGTEQAWAMGETLRELLQDRPPAALQVSTLGRCRQSAALVCEAAGLDFAAADFRPELMELHYGAWQGQRKPDLRRAQPELWARRESERWTFAPEGGESYAQASRRIADWLERLKRQEGTVVAVLHGGTSILARGLYAGLAPAGLLAQDFPQNAFYRLAAGTVTRFDTGL
ncbi:MAG: histidine phosphatase family protein [Tistlia sp.]|uniref:histidine phosphatase family protein n=1 Tax=Tistlia sp. TaxID=3057121 RepID=UPI0034A4BE9C